MASRRFPQSVVGALALVMLAACASQKTASAPEPTATAVPSASPTASAMSTASAAPTGAPMAGPSQALGQGSVWAYVVPDAAGTPLEVGVRLIGAALTGLPTAPPDGHPMPVVLTFPSGANAGVLDHVEFYWNPVGHEPAGVWDKPHFDYHFFMVDQASARAVDPANPDFPTKAAKIPDAKYIPTDFVAPPGTAVANTVPGMGLHWLDQTEPPIPGQYQFTETMINGSYDGTRTFIEPMITRDWLLTHPTLDEQLKQPQAYQKAGLWPTTYTVRYDAAKDEYAVALGGFTDRQAS